MTKLKCLIIDDDPQIIDLVAHFSTKCELIEFCISCTDPVEGLKLLSNSTFDLLFLDYNMPNLNGQDLLELKRDASKVIMITSNSQFAVNSYKYDDIVDYLVKPLDYETFNVALKRLTTRKKEQPIVTESKDHPTPTSIMVKDGNNWIPINFDDIQYIKSESNYCIFQNKSGKVMTLITLKNLEDKLPSNFMRCHRSYIINMNYVTQINLEEAFIKEDTIPISARYKDEIKSFILSKM